MKVVLAPNPNPPFNLIRICPATKGRNAFYNNCSEDDAITDTIRRNIEVGLIQPGRFHIVDSAKLPGGSISPQNDVDYFFDAWEWVD